MSDAGKAAAEREYVKDYGGPSEKVTFQDRRLKLHLIAVADAERSAMATQSTRASA